MKNKKLICRTAALVLGGLAVTVLCAQEKSADEKKEIVRLIRLEAKTKELEDQKVAAIKKAGALKEADPEIVAALLENLEYEPKNRPFHKPSILDSYLPAEDALTAIGIKAWPIVIKKIAATDDNARREYYLVFLWMRATSESKFDLLKIQVTEALAQAKTETEKARLTDLLKTVESSIKHQRAPLTDEQSAAIARAKLLTGSAIKTEDAVKSTDLIFVGKLGQSQANGGGGSSSDPSGDEYEIRVHFNMETNVRVTRVLKGNVNGGGEIQLTYGWRTYQAFVGKKAPISEVAAEVGKEYIFFVKSKALPEEKPSVIELIPGEKFEMPWSNEPVAIKLLPPTPENLAGVEKALKALEEKK